MAFDIATTLDAVQTHLDGSGLFFETHIGQPTSAVGEGPIAAIFGDTVSVVDTTLNSTIEQHVLTIRLYQGTHIGAVETLEKDGWSLVSQVMDLFYGDFQLGANIRNVDVAGEYGTSLSASRDEEAIETTPYYVADIVLPLIVNSATTLVA